MPFSIHHCQRCPCAAVVSDLVQHDFGADRAGSKFIRDIAYIHPWQGSVYLTTIIDRYSHKVVGFAMADHMKDTLLVQVLDMRMP